MRLSNVRFLEGYRRDWLINQIILDELRSRAAALVGLCIAGAEQQIAGVERRP